jgi:hypothetical protein
VSSLFSSLLPVGSSVRAGPPLWPSLTSFSRLGLSSLAAPGRNPFTSQPLISHLTNSNGCGNLQTKVPLTVSPSRPSFSPQPHVYPRASPDSTLQRQPSRTNLVGPMPKLDLNSRPFNHLQPLCRREKSQPLWNQANPASFSKIPGWGGYPECFYGMPGCGVGHPERSYGTPGVWVSQTVLRDTADGIPTSRLPSSTLLTILLAEPISFRSWLIPARSSISFRINTCKSVSKQTTLTLFIINTYEKPGEGMGHLKAGRYEKHGPAREALTIGDMPGPAPGSGEVRKMLPVGPEGPTDLHVDVAYLPSSSLSSSTLENRVLAAGAAVPFRPSQRILL